MLTSLENSKVKYWRKLQQKKYRQGEFLLTEEDLIRSAYSYGKLKTLIYTGELPFPFEDAIEVTREIINKVSMKEGCSFLGIYNFIEEKKDYQNRVLLLDHLQDPLNIGRIMESAKLFGFDSIVLSEGSADIYHPKCLKASKGALFDLNISHADLISEIAVLKKQGFKVYATGLRDNTKELYEADNADKVAVVLGNEGSGVTEEVFDVSDEIIKIDMHNIDSLNVAMAGAIVMYYFKNVQ